LALFNAEMKDNEANTRQNNGKNLYTNGNYFSQLMIVIGLNYLTADSRRLTQTTTGCWRIKLQILFARWAWQPFVGQVA